MAEKETFSGCAEAAEQLAKSLLPRCSAAEETAQCLANLQRQLSTMAATTSELPATDIQAALASLGRILHVLDTKRFALLLTDIRCGTNLESIALAAQGQIFSIAVALATSADESERCQTLLDTLLSHFLARRP